VWYNQSLIMNNYCPSLDRLREGDRVGIKFTSDRTLHLFVNGCDQGTAVYNMPEVIDIKLLWISVTHLLLLFFLSKCIYTYFIKYYLAQ